MKKKPVIQPAYYWDIGIYPMPYAISKVHKPLRSQNSNLI